MVKSEEGKKMGLVIEMFKVGENRKDTFEGGVIEALH